MKNNNVGEPIVLVLILSILLAGSAYIVIFGSQFAINKYQEYKFRNAKTYESCFMGFKQQMIYHPALFGTYEEAVEAGKKRCEEQKASEEARKKLHDEYCALIHPNYKSFEEYERCHD